MQRNGTVLIALLAVLALAAAAGGFSAGGGQSLTSDTGLGTGGGAPDPGPPSDDSDGTGGGNSVFGLGGAVGSAGSAGGSALLVAGVVVALACALVLVVVLTGDDERAPRPENDPTGRTGDPRPTLEVSYRSPEDSLVVRAWDRLAASVDSRATETPRETARRASDEGFSRETVERLAESFRAVRYGDQPPADRERAAREALEELGGPEPGQRGDDA